MYAYTTNYTAHLSGHSHQLFKYSNYVIILYNMSKIRFTVKVLLKIKSGVKFKVSSYAYNLSAYALVKLVKQHVPGS